MSSRAARRGWRNEVPVNTLDDPLHDREIGARDSTLDTTRIDDVRIGAVRPLITPALLQERVPVRDDTLSLVEASRAAVADVLHGRDDRLIVVVGPCSIHDHDQAIDYGRQLKAVADELDHGLLNEKPGLESPTLEHICLYFARRLQPDFPGLARVVVSRPTVGESCALNL